MKHIGFYRSLAARGRADLAAKNAAINGRFRLAIIYGRRSGLSTRQAWLVAWSQYREHLDLSRERARREKIIQNIRRAGA